jgi:molybdopterin/thiamine biosynthesis adenylyltransferase
MRSSIDRVDASWIHGRDQDPRQSLLRDSVVTLIGCGSIGGPVALLLAQAGVGRLRLVDGDVLKAGNISRHPLGVQDLGRFKATALAERLRESYPHLAVEAFEGQWEALPAEFGLFERSDLIISATGSWAADGGLNAAHLEGGRRPAVIYSWTEPHACAGHAVAIGERGGCLRCGFDAVGAYHKAVTAWPEGAHLRQEPACGALYQPYGSAEVGYIVSMISELALDNLLGEAGDGAHRIWVGPLRRLTLAGGALAAAWAPRLANLAGGGLLEEPWAVDSRCPACARAAAAA